LRVVHEDQCLRRNRGGLPRADALKRIGAIEENEVQLIKKFLNEILTY
jgi:hypothetical protein